jgi:MFS family permease
VLLIACRLIQGFGLGGESRGAILMAVEHAPGSKEGLLRKLAAIASGLMTANQPETWPIAVYTIILALISMMSVYFATETRKGAET